MRISDAILFFPFVRLQVNYRPSATTLSSYGQTSCQLLACEQEPSLRRDRERKIMRYVWLKHVMRTFLYSSWVGRILCLQLERLFLGVFHLFVIDTPGFLARVIGRSPWYISIHIRRCNSMVLSAYGTLFATKQRLTYYSSMNIEACCVTTLEL